MSNGTNRKRRRRSASHPPPRASAAPAAGSAAAAPRGVLGRVLGPPVPPSMSEMPTFRASLGQGLLVAASNPVLAFGPLVFVFLLWLVLLAFGFVGSVLVLAQAVAMPPLSLAADVGNALAIAGPRYGLIVALPALLVRAIFVGVLAGLILEGFERRGSVSVSGALSGLAAFPLVLGSVMLSFVALFVTQFAALFGPGLGLLLQVLTPAFVLYALGFVPFAAVRERRPLSETLRRSYAGARTPGGRHLSFCISYVLLAVLLQVFLLPGFVPETSLITANPTPVSWIAVFVLSFLHIGFTASMAYRWLAIESSVPSTPTRR